MKTRREDRSVCALAAVCLLAGSAAALGDVIVSNLPGNDATQSAALQTGRIKAMGFRMPSGDNYVFESAVVRLNVTSLGVVPQVRLWESNGPAIGALITTLDNPPITATGINNYTFTSSTPVVLQADTVYWLTVYNTGAVGIDWKASSPAVTPTGLGTHAGTFFSTNTGPNPPIGASSILTSYQINATVDSGCYADCDTSTGVGVLDVFDFLCFQNRYDAGSPYACDCDTSTGPGVCDVFDFLCFQNAFDAGCP